MSVESRTTLSAARISLILDSLFVLVRTISPRAIPNASNTCSVYCGILINSYEMLFWTDGSLWSNTNAKYRLNFTFTLWKMFHIIFKISVFSCWVVSYGRMNLILCWMCFWTKLERYPRSGITCNIIDTVHFKFYCLLGSLWKAS